LRFFPNQTQDVVGHVLGVTDRIATSFPIHAFGEEFKTCVFGFEFGVFGLDRLVLGNQADFDILGFSFLGNDFVADRLWVEYPNEVAEWEMEAEASLIGRPRHFPLPGCEVTIGV